MRMRTGAWIALTFVLGLAQVAGAATSVTLHWSKDALALQPGAGGTVTVDLKDGVSCAPAGSPDLPWVPVDVPVPAGLRVEGWSWHPGADEPLASGAVVAPAWLDLPSDAGGPRRADADPAIYSGGLAWPPDPVSFRGVQVQRGATVATFLVCPFRWDPASKELSWTPGGTLDVSFAPGAGSVEALPSSPREALAAVPAGKNGPAPAGAVRLSLKDGLKVTMRPTLDSAPVQFLIVTDTTLVAAFQPMADYKTRLGRPAAIRTVQWIARNYPTGVDLQEKIRQFITDAYLYWGTQTVIIGGDPSLVPIRYARDRSYDEGYGGRDIATDYYYACLDGNWNADGNAWYGQAKVNVQQGEIPWPGDKADLRPEIQVGRISATTPANVASFWQKYMTYTMNPTRTESYLRGVLTMGEVLFDGGWRRGDFNDSCDIRPPGMRCARFDGAEDCFAMIDTVKATPFGSYFQFDQLYEREDYQMAHHAGLVARRLNQPNVTASIVEGRNILFHMGHGDRDRWAIGDGRLLSADVMALNNGPLWPGMAYVVNCNSAAVDADCMGEAWQFSPRGGGLDYLGSTNLDFPLAARTLQNHFFKTWLRNDATTPGDAFYATTDSIGAFTGDQESTYRFLLFSIIFLGDPEMVVWKNIPRTLAFQQAPQTITLGQGPIRVKVVDGTGAAVAGATVCLYKPDDAMAVGTTDASGLVDLPFVPTEVGSGNNGFTLTASHPTGVTVQRSGGEVVVPTGRSFAVVSNYTVLDDNTRGTSGNGNGRIEVGETVGLNLSVINRGTAQANTLSASLRLDGAPAGLALTFPDSTITFGSLAQGASVDSAAAFLVRVDEVSSLEPGSGPHQVDLPLKVHFHAADRDFDQKISPIANRPELLLTRTAFREIVASGAPDSIPAPGETIGLAFELYNQGTGTASGLRAVVHPKRYTQATMVDSVVTFPDIPPGGSAVSDTVRFTVEHVFVTDPFTMLLNLEDTRGDTARTVWTRPLKMVRASRRPVGLDAAGSQTSIALSWRPRTTTGGYVWGYRVYRSANADGPYERIGSGFVPGVQVYTDPGLSPLTPYYYRVAAIDSAGVESGPTDSLLTSTCPPYLTGWPATLNEARDSSPVVAHLRGPSYQVISAADAIYAFDADGKDYYDGDYNQSTRGILTRQVDGFGFLGKPSVYDLDGDGRNEIVGIAGNGQPSTQSATTELCVFDYIGRLRWKRPLDTRAMLSTPAIGDIDGDGQKEIVFLGKNCLWAFRADATGTPFRPVISGQKPGVLLVISPSNGFEYSSVALTDLDLDGKDEIIFNTRGSSLDTDGQLYVVRATNGQGGYAINYPGFPFSYASVANTGRSKSYSSPAIGDIGQRGTSVNNAGPPDGKPDIVIVTESRVWAFDPSNANNPLMWHVALTSQGQEEPLTCSPALGDVNGDGRLDVVVGAGSRLYVLDGQLHTPLANFSPYIILGTPVATTRASSPILADLDGATDGPGGATLPEVIIGSNDSKVYAFRWTGRMLAGFPFALPGAKYHAGLLAWDVDKNDHPNLVIQGSKVNQTVILDFPHAPFDSTDTRANPWPQFRHDTRSTGSVGVGIMGPTPVEMVQLSTETPGGLVVDLRWRTALAWRQYELLRKAEPDGEWESAGTWTPDAVREGPDAYHIQDLPPAAGTWSYRIGAVDQLGDEHKIAEASVTLRGLAFRLHPAQPNPISRETTIRCDLPAAGLLRVRVLDATGRAVRHLHDGNAGPGTLVLRWDGRDDSGHPVGSGIYFVKTSGLGTASEKIVLLR